MTAIGDLCDTVRSWLNFEYSDELITSWVRMAEEVLSRSLRCKHMVQIDTGEVNQGRVLLPSDWLDLDFVRVENGKPLRYESRDNFYDHGEPSGRYTISGNYLILGGKPTVADGTVVELTYYQTIPPLGDNPNWLSQNYSTILLLSVLSAGGLYSMEMEKAAAWEAKAASLITAVNEGDFTAKTSGSVLVQRHAKKLRIG